MPWHDILRFCEGGIPRLLMCFHFQAYALSEEVDQWLLFDDTNIKYVGEWEDVVASMIASRHQPSLLFYEKPML